MESHVDDLKLISELYAAVENLERENVNVMQSNICEQHNQCLTGYFAFGMTFPTTTLLNNVDFLVTLSLFYRYFFKPCLKCAEQTNEDPKKGSPTAN